MKILITLLSVLACIGCINIPESGTSEPSVSHSSQSTISALHTTIENVRSQNDPSYTPIPPHTATPDAPVIVKKPTKTPKPTKTKKPTKTPIPPTPTPHYEFVNMERIFNLYDSNPLAAEAQYEDTRIRTSGQISIINEDYFTLKPPSTFVSGADCEFGKDQINKVINLREGQNITVHGIVKRFSSILGAVYIKIEPCYLD